MRYKESKIIMDSYKKVILHIIDSKQYRAFAESEIDEFDASLKEIFRQIKNTSMLSKQWLTEE